MAESKITILFFYGDDKHSQALLKFIAANIKILMQKFNIKQQKITDGEKLEQVKNLLIRKRILPPNQPISIPFAAVGSDVFPATKFSELLKNITTKRNIVTSPDRISIDDWNKQILDSGDNDSEAIDNSSIAKQMEKFNKQRANRLTENPSSKKSTKSYDNDEDFRAASGLEDTGTMAYDYNSGDNILEELRLEEAIDAGKTTSSRSRRK